MEKVFRPLMSYLEYGSFGSKSGCVSVFFASKMGGQRRINLYLLKKAGFLFFWLEVGVTNNNYIINFLCVLVCLFFSYKSISFQTEVTANCEEIVFKDPCFTKRDHL